MTENVHCDYEFSVGDRVVTTFGEIGTITNICTCNACKTRGFCEPCWVDTTGETHYITVSDLWSEFSTFRQIGKYHFKYPFNKGYISRKIAQCEDELKRFKHMMAVIEEIEKEGNTDERCK